MRLIKEVGKMTIAEKRNAGLHKNKIGHILWCILRALLFIGLSYIILYPILFCLSISVRLPSDMMDPTVIWLPKSFTLDNFKFVFEHTEFTAAYVRTLLLSLFCSVLQMFSCAVTGYGFARFKFRGRGILFALALLTFVVPPQIISMPLYIQYSKFTAMTGIPMINTIFPSTLSACFAQGLKAGLFIYLFRQFFKNMPKELEDAAYLDGCGPVKAFTSIMLVNAGPMLLVSFVLSFVWYWNDYINMSLFFNKSKPLAMVLNGLTTTIRGMKLEDGTIFGEIENSVYTTTFCMLFIVTPIVIYAILQKKFTESLMSTSIVG